MRFWDSSALIPLIVAEPGTELVRAWLADDTTIAIWSLTRVELVSGVERRAREGRLNAKQRRNALRDIARLCDDAHEVTDVLAVRARATTLLSHHPLRAADACQLAAALLVAAASPTHTMTMVVFDQRLAAAADVEGLDVLTWET